ncbi:MAG: TonB-dependent receptor [Treponema sp.]|nr:TonB-dependent receptor [Treponema sp.]
MKPITILLFLFIPFFIFPQEGPDEYEEYFFEDEGITVTGILRTSQQMAVIDREEIERRGAADLAVLLHETLGLNIVRHGAYGNQAGVNLRGFDSKRIAFLIDGVPADSALDGKFDISQIDLNSVERIEVIYGGSDTKYNVSGALGGIVNIITVKKQKRGLRLSGSVANISALPGEYRDRSGEKQGAHWEDLLDTQNFALSTVYGGEKTSITANVFASRAENHFLFTDYLDYVRRKDNNEVWDGGAAASVVRDLSDLAKVIASAGIYYGDKNFPATGFSSNFGKQQDFSARSNFMLDAPHAFRDDFASEASLAWYFYRMDYSSPAGEFSRHAQHSLSAINRWSWCSGERLVMRSGGDYRFINLDSTEMGIRFRHDGGIYLTAEYRPATQFLVIPSVKAVFSSAGAAEITAIPKLGLLWNITDSLSLKNNYFRSFKFPDFEELYWAGGGGFGNPDLRPEDGWGADLGAEWRVTNLLILESVVFTQWIKDSIHWFSKSGGIWRPENVGEAVFFGLDSRLGLEIPVDIGPVEKIMPSISYQYLLTFLLSYGYTFASEKRIPYSPEHTIGASLDFIWASGSFTISAHYESLRYHDTANLTALRPLFLLNAAINQKIGKNFSTFGTLRNILNESYESFYDYPMPGITLTLGMRINIDTGHNND